ncbi:MAG: hypothetical protein ABR587_00925 [Candidatus Binatia bacterium]
MRWVVASAMAAALLVAPLAHAQDATDAPEAALQEAPAFLEKTAERGPVKARVRLEPAAPVIGDVVTLTIEVTAADGIDLMMPEFGQSMDRFSVREFVPKETVDASGSIVSTQRYVLEPPLSGPQAIPPLLIEFVDRRPGQRLAPDGEQSYELVTERIPFEVSSVVPANASNELKPLRDRLEPLREPGRMWPWLLALLALAAIAAPLVWRSLKAARAKALRRSAYDVARARLDALSSHKIPAEEDEIDNFFVELSALIRRYLEDRFELRAPELTTEEFLQVASASPDLDEAHQGFLRDFLRRADMVKFARFLPPPDEIAAGLKAASRFLDETRETASAVHGGAPATGAAHV